MSEREERGGYICGCGLDWGYSYAYIYGLRCAGHDRIRWNGMGWDEMRGLWMFKFILFLGSWSSNSLWMFQISMTVIYLSLVHFCVDGWMEKVDRKCSVEKVV